jgi:DNA-binding response OmpR family regulator
MTTQILVVDDDAELRDLLRDYLVKQGIEVSVLHDAGSLERRLERERPDLIVLDLMMPGVDGLTALRKLRASGDDIPVIMLTARADDVDRIVGLELGADDYLGKPFAFHELVARVRALGRRGPGSPAVVQRGDLVVDRARHRASRAGIPLTLTRKEFGVLECLAGAAGAAVSAEELLEHVWDAHADPFSNTVAVTVGRLRRKLGDPPLIETVVGVGYRL